MPRDITVTLEDGTAHVYKNAPDNVTPEQVQARAEQEFGMGVKALDGGRSGNAFLKEAGRVADKVVRGGLFSAPKFIADTLLGHQKQVTEEPVSASNLAPASLLLRARDKLVPKSADEALVNAMTPSTPQTTTGKYIGEAGAGALAAATGGPMSVASKAAPIGAITGLSSEAAGQATKSPTYPEGHPLARLAGGLAGGGLTSVYQAVKPNATNLIKTATKGVTDQDWTKAKALEMALDDMGMPHLKSQLLGPNSSLDDVVRDASANQSVRPSLLAALRDVTGKAGKAFEVWANQHLPIQADERRDFLANLQRIAAEKESELLKGSNTAYRGKLPPGVASEVYPEDFMKNLRDELSAMAKDPAQLKGSIAGQSILTDLLPRLQTKGNGMAKGELNNIIKDLNMLTQKEGWAGLGKTKVGQLLKDYTSNDFGSARAAKVQYMKDNVEPMQQGLAGDIAHGKGGPDANKYTAAESTLANVFPVDKAQPLAIRKLAEDVGGEQVGLLLREHLTRNFERAAKGLDENVTSPAKFVEAVLGTPAQRKNTEAALMESAKAQGQNPLAVKAGFQRLINAFATFKDLKIAPTVSPTNLQIEAGKSVPGAIVAPHSKIARYLSERATAGTYQKIADMVSSKDGLAQLEKIARSQDPAYAQAVIRAMVATGGGDNSPALQPSNTSE